MLTQLLTPGDLPHHDHPQSARSGAPLVRIPKLQLVCRHRRSPRLPWWLRPFARFRAADHFRTLRRTARCANGSSAFFADRDLAPPEGRITALLQARVFGYVFNPLSVFWCHDRDGRLRHVIAEVHNTYGGRHAYLLPPADLPVVAAKEFYVSPFNPVDGYYLVRAPRPDSEVDITVALHRDIGRPVRRQPARTAASGNDQTGCDHANHFAAGAVGGGRAHPDTGDQAVVASSSGGAAMSAPGLPEDLLRSNRFGALAGRREGAAGPRRRARRRVIADRLLRRAAARLPLRLVYPDGTVVGAADPTVPTLVIHQPRSAGPPHRSAWPDRLRRVLHGRRMVVGRPHRGVDGLRHVGGRPGAARTAAAAADRPGVSAALARRQPRSGAAQRRRALRLVQRPVRRVPRRDHDLLVRAVHRVAGVTRPIWPTRNGARSTGCSTWPSVGPRQPGPRDRHRMGRVVHPRGRPRSARPLGDLVGRAAAPGAAAGGRGGAVRLGPDRPVRLPRRRRVL